jgi:predicted nucleotidyltransferase
MHDLLARVAADLGALHARYAIVGGHAVSTQTEPRFTRDIDLAVAVANDREAEDLVHALAARGYRISALLEPEATGRLATVRLEHAAAPGVAIDLLFATAGIEAEVVAASSPLKVLDKVTMPVARVGHLLALKTLSVDDQRRPQDRIDLAALLRVAGAGDLQTVEQALALITRRGCHRGRDLPALFARLRAELTG